MRLDGCDPEASGKRGMVILRFPEFDLLETVLF
jgi:hypothetical protein